MILCCRSDDIVLHVQVKWLSVHCCKICCQQGRKKRSHLQKNRLISNVFTHCTHNQMISQTEDNWHVADCICNVPVYIVVREASQERRGSGEGWPVEGVWSRTMWTACLYWSWRCHHLFGFSLLIPSWESHISFSASRITSNNASAHDEITISQGDECEIERKEKAL